MEICLGPVIRTIGWACDRTNCIHGDCSINEKCICHDGWTSENCNQSLIISEFIKFSIEMIEFSFKDNQVVRVVHVYIILLVKLSLVSIQSQLIVVIVDQVTPVDIVKSVRNRHFLNFLLFFLQYKKAIVVSCERTLCIHGRCSKPDFYTEICVCNDGWTGIDCSERISPFHTTNSITTNKNLTQNDREAYLKWLNTNYGIGQLPNPLQPSFTTPFIPNRYSKTRKSI